MVSKEKKKKSYIGNTDKRTQAHRGIYLHLSFCSATYGTNYQIWGTDYLLKNQFIIRIYYMFNVIVHISR